MSCYMSSNVSHGKPQAASIAVEDFAISTESLRQGASPQERMTLPLSQIKHDLKEVRL